MKQKISSVDFSLLRQSGHTQLVLDVRTPAEVAGQSLPGSHNVPLQDVCTESIQSLLKSQNHGDEPVYLLCGSGMRAEKAAEMIAGAVNNPLWVIEGGINALKNTDTPLTVSDSSVISLERQVRITAGFMVVLGVVLGSFVAPGFYGLSAFVGAGLMFAGITDSCGMAMVLAKMPWNQRR